MDRHLSIDGLWQRWWRVGGAAGIIFLVFFFVGGFALQGDSPSRDDSIADMRAYFADEGQRYLIGDYLVSLGFVFFYLPYLVTLRALLGSAEASPPVWSRLALIGGLASVILAAVSSLFMGTLAIGVAEHQEVDDSAVRTLMELDTYAGSLLPLPMALFLLASSLVIWDTAVLWRWLAGLGVLAAVLLTIGAAWPIDGDEEGAIAALGFIGAPLAALWGLLTSVNLLTIREPPSARESRIATPA